MIKLDYREKTVKHLAIALHLLNFLNSFVYRKIIHNSWKLEIIQTANRRKDKQI